MMDNSVHEIKKSEKVVYIFNLSEDVWPFISNISDEKARQIEIDENANLGDRDLLSVMEEHDGIFITPRPIDPDFFAYVSELFNSNHIQVLTPKHHSGEICEDCIADPDIMEALVTAANSVKKLTVVSYTASMQFFHLVDVLRKKGITVYTQEAPEEEDAWTVNFFGSKSGIRQLVQQSTAREPDLLMPNGVICFGTFDAAKIAAKKYIKENGVVIKTNKGHAGAGVLIFRSGDLPGDYRDCEKAISKILHKDKYWDKFPIIVESLVNVSTHIAGGFPNVEFRISKSGKIDFLYMCGLRVTSAGVFQGVEINAGIMSERIAARVIDTGFYVGEQYASNGYRGYYELDFVAAKNGDIVVTESNTRRTGGTHVYKTAVTLIGKEFMRDSYILSNNSYTLPNRARPSFRTIRELLAPLLFDKTKKTGIVIASSGLLSQGNLAYMVFGKNEKQALETEKEMEGLLQNLH